jgi:hypothetical protein
MTQFLQTVLSKGFIGLLPQPYFDLWIDGLVEVQQALNTSLWDTTECHFCYIEGFLMGYGRLPWLTCLKHIGEDKAYRRTTECLKSQGCDVEKLEKFVDEVLRFSFRNRLLLLTKEAKAFL